MFPGVSDTLFRQPGYQALDLTRGFASPPRDGFALIEKGSSLWDGLLHRGCQIENASISESYKILPASVSHIWKCVDAKLPKSFSGDLGRRCLATAPGYWRARTAARISLRWVALITAIPGCGTGSVYVGRNRPAA